MCDFPGCDRPARKRGLCSAHHRQQARGMPLAPLEDRSLAARIARNTEKSGDCLLWTGAESSRGYGRMNLNGERYRVHRLAYEAVHGFVPEHVHIHHTCGNKLCCNVAHLEALPAGDHHRLHVTPAAK
jgi:hypothetical protein